MKSESAASSTSLSLWREASDTHVRSRFAGYYYLLAWGLLWFTSSEPWENLWAWGGGSLLLLLFFALRSHHRPSAQLDPAQLQRWLDLHWLAILLQSMTWGLMLAGIQLHPEIVASHLLIMLSVVVFGTSLAFTYPMRMGRCALAILLTYLPSTAIKFHLGIGDIGESVALVIYLGYLGLFLYRWNREYRIGLERELRLLLHGEQLDRLSRTDALTGLGNRYQFNALLPAWLANARRQNGQLTLVLLDIDYFKAVNDQYGHRTGDLGLQAFAERMRQVFRRDSDILLRLGGEEFAVLMPDTMLEQAIPLAERFRADLAAQPLRVEAQVEELPLTCSLGIGHFLPLCDDSAETFYKRVDDALYRAKARGRNRLELA
ncbi:GGDEF domain-containing protein [Pseudomonas borbori]|uniref:diguanylate cyclase n=1 Tax=Pseudomonas borbori TaxID=289003 RepID=A0A1I5NBX3_9PSED|nr:GGDEF domain-containing protein [Pseudomonas borbori]SFP19202.1 diguanylate cyclase (GGDEF) domain-containing protein [Pseudomonas borbori]